MRGNMLKNFKLGKKERRLMNFWVYCHHCGYFGYQGFKGIRRDGGGTHYVFYCVCREEILVPRDTLAAVIDRTEAAA